MRRYAILTGLLAVAYVAFSVVVATGSLHGFDVSVSRAFAQLYRPGLLTLFRGIALLGGLELTALLAVGLFLYLWRVGYRLAAFAAFALPLASLAETAYKRTIVHPAPPASIAHPDGPSLTLFFEGSPGGGWSFPSGHMTRAVVIYGLLAFVIQRLGGPGRLRQAAVPLAIAVVLLEAFDRLYLEVHWESDVLGGILLGAIFLSAAIAWLEWSEARAE
jgi:undecaprenyl-diphosphatase